MAIGSDYADELKTEVLTEMADNFFSRRCRLDERLENFASLLERVKTRRAGHRRRAEPAPPAPLPSRSRRVSGQPRHRPGNAVAGLPSPRPPSRWPSPPPAATARPSCAPMRPCAKPSKTTTKAAMSPTPASQAAKCPPPATTCCTASPRRSTPKSTPSTTASAPPTCCASPAPSTPAG